MSEPRDPRRDPRPGDRLEEGFYRLSVVAVYGIWLEIEDSRGKYKVTMSGWRRWVDKPEVRVIHAAPEAEQHE